MVVETLFGFLIELDKLKSVYRRAYLTDRSRNENSAEHSWHLALALLTLEDELHLEIDLFKAIKIALVHDICEIGAGDISVFDPKRLEVAVKERQYIEQLAALPVAFAEEISLLWEEYEAQQSPESLWVKVVDRLLPFMLNLSNGGKTWRELNASKKQVLEINQVVAQQAPEVYQWMLEKVDIAVSQGWLLDE